ncbi:uncharacterized protein L201_006545 [Kwoniella dendrophila CBS 6074]|uniref:PCI domain-containing protein n=1 Tax=Kwoniella dendrophila CBS 6074 TaxID=1295534 RepID=A0AAX4K3B4_9TREE
MTDLSSKLEPYLLLARSTKGASAAKIISDVTAAPGIYTFSELLDLPNIQQLSTDPTHQSYYQLLRLFAYGTLTDYESGSSSYPPLIPSQILKLKHLTLVTLALQHRSLSYDQLLSELRLDSIRQLEDLIIDVIYAGLLGGKMHHHEKVLHVDWVAGRDLEEKNLMAVQAGLTNWCETARTLLSALDAEIQSVRQKSAAEAQELAEYKAYRDNEYAKISLELKNKQSKQAYSGFGGPTRSGGFGPGFGSGGSGVGGMPNESLLAAVTGNRLGGGGGGGSGRLLTRNIPSPDELEGRRSFKRSRD